MALCLASLGFTSCLGDGKTSFTNERQLSEGNNMSYITDLQTGEEYLLGTGANYNFTFESYEQVTTIKVSGLQVRAGGGSYSFNIVDRKFTYDRFGAIVLDIPEINDLQNNVKITDFSLNFLQRQIAYANTGINIPVWTITYTVDGRYRVRVVQNAIYYFGYTDRIQLPDQDIEDQTSTAYFAVAFDPRNIEGNKVKTNVYAYNILLPGFQSTGDYVMEQTITSTITADGYTFEGMNCKLYENLKTEPTKSVINSITGTASFILKDDGIKRNPNLDLRFTIDNSTQYKAELGYSFTDDLMNGGSSDL